MSYVKPGDRVIMSFKPFCGRCYYCLGGRPQLCNDRELAAASARRITWKGKPVLQMGGVASFAEYMVTSESGVVKIPNDMPMAEAALLGCAVMTGVGAALYTAQVPGGAIVAVVGCGGIGLNIIQGCRLAGASQIIAIDVVPYKLELARKFGATHTLNAKEVDPVKKVKELTGRMGAEYAFEAIGSPDTARQAFDMLRAGGTAVIVGVMGPAELRFPGMAFRRREEGDRLSVRQRALPRAHAQADRPVHAGAAEHDRAGLAADAARRREPRLPADARRQGGALGARDQPRLRPRLRFHSRPAPIFVS